MPFLRRSPSKNLEKSPEKESGLDPVKPAGEKKSGGKWGLVKANIKRLNRGPLLDQISDDPSIATGEQVAKLGFYFLDEGWGNVFFPHDSNSIYVGALIVEWAIKNKKYTLSPPEVSKLAFAHYEIWHKRGVLSEQYNISRALRYFDESFKHLENVADLNTLITYAKVLQGMGDNTKALSSMMTLMSNAEETAGSMMPTLMLYTAALLKATKDFDRAATYFFEAMNSGPPRQFKRMDIMFLVARTLEESTMNDDIPAEDGYRLVYSNLVNDGDLLDTTYEGWINDFETWRKIADKTAVQGSWELAADLYGQGLRRDPKVGKNSKHWFILGKAFFRCGKLSEAQVAAKHAQEIDPLNAKVEEVAQRWAGKSKFFETFLTGELPPLLDMLPKHEVKDMRLLKAQAMMRGQYERKHLKRAPKQPLDGDAAPTISRINGRCAFSLGGRLMVLQVRSSWSGTISAIKLVDMTTEETFKMNCTWPFSPLFSREIRREQSKFSLNLKPSNHPDRVSVEMRFTDSQRTNQKTISLIITSKAKMNTHFGQRGQKAFPPRVAISDKKMIALLERSSVTTNESEYLMLRTSFFHKGMLFLLNVENHDSETRFYVFHPESNQRFLFSTQREYLDRGTSTRTVARLMMRILDTHPSLSHVLDKWVEAHNIREEEDKRDLPMAERKAAKYLLPMQVVLGKDETSKVVKKSLLLRTTKGKVLMATSAIFDRQGCVMKLFAIGNYPIFGRAFERNSVSTHHSSAEFFFSPLSEKTVQMIQEECYRRQKEKVVSYEAAKLSVNASQSSLNMGILASPTRSMMASPTKGNSADSEEHQFKSQREQAEMAREREEAAKQRRAIEEKRQAELRKKAEEHKKAEEAKDSSRRKSVAQNDATRIKAIAYKKEMEEQEQEQSSKKTDAISESKLEEISGTADESSLQSTSSDKTASGPASTQGKSNPSLPKKKPPAAAASAFTKPSPAAASAFTAKPAGKASSKKASPTKQPSFSKDTEKNEAKQQAEDEAKAKQWAEDEEARAKKAAEQAAQKANFAANEAAKKKKAEDEARAKRLAAQEAEKKAYEEAETAKRKAEEEKIAKMNEEEAAKRRDELAREAEDQRKIRAEKEAQRKRVEEEIAAKEAQGRADAAAGVKAAAELAAANERKEAEARHARHEAELAANQKKAKGLSSFINAAGEHEIEHIHDAEEKLAHHEHLSAVERARVKDIEESEMVPLQSVRSVNGPDRLMEREMEDRDADADAKELALDHATREAAHAKGKLAHDESLAFIAVEERRTEAYLFLQGIAFKALTNMRKRDAQSFLQAYRRAAVEKTRHLIDRNNGSSPTQRKRKKAGTSIGGNRSSSRMHRSMRAPSSSKLFEEANMHGLGSENSNISNGALRKTNGHVRLGKNGLLPNGQDTPGTTDLDLGGQNEAEEEESIFFRGSCSDPTFFPPESLNNPQALVSHLRRSSGLPDPSGPAGPLLSSLHDNVSSSEQPVGRAINEEVKMLLQQTIPVTESTVSNLDMTTLGKLPPSKLKIRGNLSKRKKKSQRGKVLTQQRQQHHHQYQRQQMNDLAIGEEDMGDDQSTYVGSIATGSYYSVSRATDGRPQPQKEKSWGQRKDLIAFIPQQSQGCYRNVDLVAAAADHDEMQTTFIEQVRRRGYPNDTSFYKNHWYGTLQEFSKGSIASNHATLDKNIALLQNSLPFSASSTECICALADSKGSISEATGKLLSADYYAEMRLVCSLLPIVDLATQFMIQKDQKRVEEIGVARKTAVMNSVEQLHSRRPSAVVTVSSVQIDHTGTLKNGDFSLPHIGMREDALFVLRRAQLIPRVMEDESRTMPGSRQMSKRGVDLDDSPSQIAALPRFAPPAPPASLSRSYSADVEDEGAIELHVPYNSSPNDPRASPSFAMANTPTASLTFPAPETEGISQVLASAGAQRALPSTRVDNAIDTLLAEKPLLVVMSRKDAYKAHQDELLEKSPDRSTLRRPTRKRG
jgi:hypothetical protein